MRRRAWRSSIVALLLVTATFGRLAYIQRKLEKQAIQSWDPSTRVFNWGVAFTVIPSGFDYERQNGIDSFVGTFHSQDGRTRVHHDIGELAGEHGDHTHISFPNDGCANFRIEADSLETSATVAAAIRSGFRSRSPLPEWLRRQLPKWIVSDCRL